MCVFVRDSKNEKIAADSIYSLCHILRFRYHMRSSRYWLIWNVALPLAIGALIYCLADSDVMFVQWLFPGIKSWLSSEITDNTVIRVLRNYGCDFLWAYALIGSVIWILRDEYRWFAASLVSSFVFEVFIEFLQKKQIIRGYFDICDILIELIANLLVIYIWSRRKNYEKME